jgi:parallel beta-helix repeat protein
LLDGTLEEVQARSAGIYQHSIWFGAKMEADDRARNDPSAMSEPFGDDLRVAIEDLLAALPAFARQFPSALAMEDENRAFFVGVEQVTAARAVAFKARQAELLTPEDHADLDAGFEAAQAGHDPVAAKGGRVGVRSARNLAVAAFVAQTLAASALLTTANAFGFTETVRNFAIAAQVEIVEVFAAEGPDIRRSVALNMAKLLQPGPLPAAPKEQKLRTLVVSPQEGEGDYTRIQDAIADAPEGSRIVIKPGVYNESLRLSKQLELIGDGPVDQIVITTTKGAALYCTAPMAQIRGLTFSREVSGYETRGFGVWVGAGAAEFEDCILTSRAGSCVSITGKDARPTFRRCKLNDSSDSGAFILNGAKSTMEDCEVVNSAGPGFLITGAKTAPVLRRCVVRDGSDDGYRFNGQASGLLDGCLATGNAHAGILVMDSAAPIVRDCVISKNGRAAVWINDADCSAVFENNDLRGNAKGSWRIAPGAEANITRRDNLED